MYAFNYHRAESTADAVARLEAAEDGQLLAGGQTLIPTLKQRLAQPTDLIDINAINDLREISAQDDFVVVGATARHAEVASSDVVRGLIPALANMAGGIGDPQVRNRGTLGGSIANADPAADYAAAVVALDATVQTDRRTITADEFFVDLFETALEPGEIVTRVSFPVPARAAYAKFPNPASRYAIVGVMVAVTQGSVRVAVTGAGARAFRVLAMEQALAASFDADAIAHIAIEDAELNEDIHASAEYRAHLVNVMARRAVMAAG